MELRFTVLGAWAIEDAGLRPAKLGRMAEGSAAHQLADKVALRGRALVALEYAMDQLVQHRAGRRFRGRARTQHAVNAAPAEPDRKLLKFRGEEGCPGGQV